jgi:CRP-like cAMP-binding protein
MDASRTPKANGLLSALPDAAYRRLLPDLELTTLRVGETLFLPTARLTCAYFPTSSIVTASYAIERDGATAKAWPVGREGMVGISLVLGGPTADHRANVQFGGLAFRLPAPALLAEFQRAGALHHLLLRYVLAVVTQASQLGMCSHYHLLEPRLCRFLARVFDRVPGDEVAITQVRLAELLGVRRVTVTHAATHLQEAGIVEYTRGRVRLISREKLEERACACNVIIRRAFEAVAQKGSSATQRRRSSQTDRNNPLHVGRAVDAHPAATGNGHHRGLKSRSPGSADFRA